jgi:hypothetical protein
MKWGDNVSEGEKHYIDSLFLFSTIIFQKKIVSRMSAKESFVEKL